MKELIIETTAYDAESIPDRGNRFLTGNGYLGVRGTLEEHGKAELAAVNLAGIYDRKGDGWREPLNAPHPFSIRLYRAGEALTLPQAAVTAHRQWLDARHGVHHRDTLFACGVRWQAERFAHMEQVHLLCLRGQLTAPDAQPVRLEVALDGDVWDIHGPHYREMTLESREGALCARATSNEGGQVGVAVLLTADAPISRRDETRGRARVAVLDWQPRAGETLTLTLTAAVYTTQDAPEPMVAALAEAGRAPGYDALMVSHARCWEALWSHALVEIDGDEEAERALNYSIYHLLSIAPRHAPSLSVPARGLSGQTYKGAIFWDTEMFMLDFYLAVLPQAAKSILRYRIDTLPGALDKARQYGLRGAFYAWESQEGGVDACSDYNVTDVFTGRPMRTYFRDKQIHITAAVVYGLCKYERWTGEDALWREGGAEVLVEAARFYHSLLVRQVEREVFELRDVIGPDEYHERVDNNAYTNEMARFVWRQALAVLGRLKTGSPEAYGALQNKLHFEAELPGFEEAAEKLKRQQPDARGVIEQFDGYFALEDASVEQVRARLLNPKEYWGGAYGVAAQTQVIKQADVITLLYMLPELYPASALKANYDYYLPRTEHGSSLSACMYALAACAVGKPEEAMPLLMKSASADLAGGGKQWAGLVYIGGTHPAAAGGAYMALLFGLLGARISEDGQLTLQPGLPEGWQRVRCRLRFRGEDREVEGAR